MVHSAPNLQQQPATYGPGSALPEVLAGGGYVIQPRHFAQYDQVPDSFLYMCPGNVCYRAHGRMSGHARP